MLATSNLKASWKVWYASALYTQQRFAHTTERVPKAAPLARFLTASKHSQPLSYSEAPAVRDVG